MASKAIQKDVIGQIRTASKNKIALLVGILLGGFVPVMSYFLAHVEMTPDQWYVWRNPSMTPFFVVGCLIFSALTVYEWCHTAFDQQKYKAFGYVVAIEGVMVTTSIQWLAITALVYLVCINATATGCTLALKDRHANQKARSKKK